jgi:hypothetical protein
MLTIKQLWNVHVLNKFTKQKINLCSWQVNVSTSVMKSTIQNKPLQECLWGHLNLAINMAVVVKIWADDTLKLVVFSSNQTIQEGWLMLCQDLRTVGKCLKLFKLVKQTVFYYIRLLSQSTDKGIMSLILMIFFVQLFSTRSTLKT